MRSIVTALAALALTAPGLAQTTKPKTPAKAPAKAAAPARPTLPTATEMKDAADTLSLLVSAFNSKDVPTETKDGLLLCLYGNPLGRLSAGLAETLVADKSIDAKSPTQRLLVLAALCGAPVPKAGDAKPAEPAEPAKDK